MANKLAAVALIGLAVSAVCLGAAAAIGGKEAGNLDFSFLGDRPRCAFELSGQNGSRTIAWDGDDTVSLAMSADAQYKRGEGDQVVVNGDTAILPHIRVREGKIDMDCRRWRDSDRITILLPGKRTFSKFRIAGSGSLALNDLDQPKVKIGVAGSGDVQASGKTDNLEIGIAGSGKAKLGQLQAQNVKLHVAGSGDSEVAPQDSLDVHIAGSGTVRLLSEPKHMETHIAGSGEIIHGK